MGAHRFMIISGITITINVDFPYTDFVVLVSSEKLVAMNHYRLNDTFSSNNVNGDWLLMRVRVEMGTVPGFDFSVR